MLAPPAMGGLSSNLLCKLKSGRSFELGFDLLSGKRSIVLMVQILEMFAHPANGSKENL